MSKVLYEKHDRIAYVTLNRPEAMNAIDLEMHEQLWQVWSDFRDDDAVEVAIVTGAGDEAFCAGADLKTHLPHWVTQADALLPRRKIADGLGGITRGLHRIYKPIIAAVNGWALAGGLETALACDIRIASEKAQFGSFEVRRGFHHGDGGIVRLVNICGVGVALEMLLTGDPIDAQRALACNMVSRVVPHDDLMEAAEDLAARILRNDAWAVRSAKETILGVIGRPLDDQLAYEAFTGYSGAANPTVTGLLDAFAERTDPGRND
jgi:enoyl-CoA hydratase/carnithine racemase